VELAEKMAQLTPQQFKVLMLMSQGLLNKQIAYELGVTEATIKVHVSAIMRRFGASNRTQAVMAANMLLVSNPISKLRR
jgi:DNA-binding NarL/FixJ family response regulator